MLLHHENLSPGDAEYERLLAAHRAEMEVLERNLDKERARQRDTLKEKVHSLVCFASRFTSTYSYLIRIKDLIAPPCK